MGGMEKNYWNFSEEEGKKVPLHIYLSTQSIEHSWNSYLIKLKWFNVYDMRKVEQRVHNAIFRAKKRM